MLRTIHHVFNLHIDMKKKKFPVPSITKIKKLPDCVEYSGNRAVSPSLTAPSGQDERVYDQTGLSAAHPHPARPCNPQAAVLDPQDRSLPSAALAAQMPKGNDPVMTPRTKKLPCPGTERSGWGLESCHSAA